MGKAVGKITETGMPSGVGKSLCPENWVQKIKFRLLPGNFCLGDLSGTKSQ